MLYAKAIYFCRVVPALFGKVVESIDSISLSIDKSMKLASSKAAYNLVTNGSRVHSLESTKPCWSSHRRLHYYLKGGFKFRI